MDRPHPRVSTCCQLYAAAPQVRGRWLISLAQASGSVSSGVINCLAFVLSVASQPPDLCRGGVGWWTWPASGMLGPHRNFYVLLLEFVASI